MVGSIDEYARDEFKQRRPSEITAPSSPSVKINRAVNFSEIAPERSITQIQFLPVDMTNECNQPSRPQMPGIFEFRCDKVTG
jgi:hypothetical protein